MPAVIEDPLIRVDGRGCVVALGIGAGTAEDIFRCVAHAAGSTGRDDLAQALGWTLLAHISRDGSSDCSECLGGHAGKEGCGEEWELHFCRGGRILGCWVEWKSANADCASDEMRKLHPAGSRDVLIVFPVHVLILHMTRRKGGNLRLRFKSRGSVYGNYTLLSEYVKFNIMMISRFRFFASIKYSRIVLRKMRDTWFLLEISLKINCDHLAHYAPELSVSEIHFSRR